MSVHEELGLIPAPELYGAPSVRVACPYCQNTIIYPISLDFEDEEAFSIGFTCLRCGESLTFCLELQVQAVIR